MTIRYVKLQSDEMFVFLTIFLNGLGFVVTIQGINIVYCVAGMALILLFANFICNPTKLGNFFDRRKRFLVILFLVWIVYALIQKIVVIDTTLYKLVIRQLLTNFMVIVFALYLFDFSKEKSLNAIYLAFLFVLITNTCLGCVEWMFDIHYVEASSFWDDNHVRAFSSNVNEYATTMYCSLMGVLLINQKRKNFLTWMLIFLSIICIIKSSSRGIFLALLIFVLLYFLAFLYFKFFSKYIMVLEVAIALVAGIAMMVVALGKLDVIVNMFIDKFSGEGNSLSDIYRWTLIKGAIKCFVDSNGIGVGPGQSIYLLQMNVHNFFIEILAEYGLLLFILILYVFVYIWMGAFKTNLNVKSRSMYFAIIPSLIVASLSSSSINKFKLFWVLIVMLFLLRKSNFFAKEST